MYAHTQTFLSKDHGRSIVRLPATEASYLSCQTAFTFISRWGIIARALAHMLDSLVRVSRRGDEKHFARVAPSHDGLAGRRSRTHALSRANKQAWPERGKIPPRHHCFPSVPFQQFQVLFHSLFKVLFIFPSRYLFAIGLPSIFSFRWNLPPT